MKVLKCYSENDFRIEEVQKPQISDTEMLIEMLYCGLCGSDVTKIFDHSLKKPDVYGHEVVGRVTETGKEVKKFKTGDIVVAAHHIPCGICIYCKHKNHTMCAQFKKTNIFPGGFSQYIKLSEKHINNTTFKLPEGLNPLKAVFIEPLACCIRAMDRIDRLAGDVFSITGAGTIGILFLLLIKLEDLKVVMIDIDKKRLELAETLGADLIVNPCVKLNNIPVMQNIISDNSNAGESKTRYKNLLEVKIKDVFFNGIDAAVITATNQQTLSDALSYIRPGGSINIFGLSDKNSIIPVDFNIVYKNELTIKSTYSATPDTLKEAYNLIISEKIDVFPLISDVLSFSDFKKGLDMMISKKIYKAIFKF